MAEIHRFTQKTIMCSLKSILFLKIQLDNKNSFQKAQKESIEMTKTPRVSSRTTIETRLLLS
jgi:hypothetical protein